MRKEAEAAALVGAQPMDTDDGPSSPKIKEEPEDDHPGFSGDVDLTLDDLTVRAPVPAPAPAPRDTAGDTATPMVVDDAAPGPSRQPWADHRAYLKKRLAEDWKDPADRSKSPRLDPMVVDEAPEAEPAGVNELDDIDCRQIHNPTKGTMRCAIQVRPLSKSRMNAPVIGNAFADPLGYTTRVIIEAGRYGLPHVTLVCRVHKPKVVPDKANEKDRVPAIDALSQAVSIEPNDYHEFKATWRPGVRVLGQWMMDTMDICQMTSYEAPLHPHNEVIIGQCPKDAEQKPNQGILDRVTALAFVVNSTRMVDAEEKYWAGLSGSVKATLNRIFSESEPLNVTIWMRSFPDCATAWQDWGRFLVHHVNNHVPPLAQYMNAQGQIVCHWNETETLQEFAKGMYNVYRIAKGVEDRTSPPKDYYAFPQQTTWQTFTELGVTITVPIVRDVQHMRNQVAYINTTQFRIYVQRIPRFAGKQRIDNNDFCFVRINRKTDKAKVGRSPPPGSAIRLCLDNSNAYGPHLMPSLGSEFHYGTVVEDDDGCARTGTDFCIWLRYNARAGPLETRAELRDLDDRLLLRAYMQVTVDTTAAERDLVGGIKLATPEYDPETLTSIREAIMQKPADVKRKTVNLCKRKPAAWKDFKKEQKTACGGNEGQYECIIRLEKVGNNFVGVSGPPGTGKTATVARTMLGAVTQGLKILGVGPQNISVDGVAMKFWSLLPDKYKSGDEEKMFLRLATRSAEMRAFIAVKNYTSPTISTPDEMQSFNEPPTEDPVELTIAWAETVTDWKNYDRELRQAQNKGVTYVKALEEQSKQADRKKANVPVKMTSGWHIHKAVLVDGEIAQDSFHMERMAWTQQGVFTDDVIDAEVKGDKDGLIGPTMLEAFKSERISEEEFAARVIDGRIPGFNERRKFRRYTELANLYVKKGGDLTRDEKDDFTTQWELVMATVFARLDGVFTTCNNAGSGLVDTAFRPDAIFCDEAGQVGLAALGNVLTTFSGWKVIFWFGDPQQLLPFTVAGKYNEMRNNATLSALGLFNLKNFEMIRLTVQYRMAPAIVQWVNTYFYENTLVNHASVTADNDYRRIGRKISREIYGIKGPKGDGSEYWHINVARGFSRHLRSNTSLVNYANSNVIVELSGHLLRGGIAAKDIGILTYYADQKLLHFRLLGEAKANSGQTWNVEDIDLSTVDAYQGRELSAGILDIVYANNEADIDHKGKVKDAEDDDVHSAVGRARLSAHIRDAHRLCCALTRFRDILVVVYQASALTLAIDKKGTRQHAALRKMVADAHERGLIYDDETHLDTHPESIKEKAAWTKQAEQQYLNKRKVQKAAYLSNSLPRALKTEIFPLTAHELPVYNTRHEKTSHPTDIAAAAKAATTTTDDAPKKTLQEMRDDPDTVWKMAMPQRQGKDAKRAGKVKAAKTKEAGAVKALAPKGNVKVLSAAETEAAKGRQT